MLPVRSSWPARSGWFVLVVGLAGSAQADSRLLNGSLGQWLDATAAPQLAELLSTHPRFKGETVRFVELRDGQPLATGTALAQAVEQRLTQQLLRREGVRLAWRDEPETCAVPQDIPYLLGLEIRRDGSRSHRLNISMVDVEEGVWVSGVSLSWEGRLSLAERAALDVKVDVGIAGSTENPLSARDSTRISEIMRGELQCSLPGGLDGPVYLQVPPEAVLAAIAQSLGRAISVTPLAALTLDRERAEWVMELKVRRIGAAGQELVLTLRDTTDDAVVQQVASVFVTGLNVSLPPDPRTIVATNTVEGEPLLHPAAEVLVLPRTPELLTQLSVRDSERNGICDANDAQTDGCVEVDFRLLRPAYLLVMSTQDQRLRSQSCGRNLRLTRPGERRYRIRIPLATQTGTQPDAGFYVLATENRDLALRILRHLNSGPGVCASARGRQSLAAWLSGMKDLLREHEVEIDWRASHLRHSANGIVRL